MDSRFFAEDTRFLSRPTRAVIDLSAIAGNYHYLQRRAGSAAVFPVVKADAYGHGAARVARRLEEEGAARFAVAIAEEGIELRRAGIRGEILILGFCDPHDAPLHQSYGLTPILYDLSQARSFREAAQALPRPLAVHLKIDTGLGRLGIAPGDLAEAVDILRQSPGLLLRGVLTQLARAYDPEPSAVAPQIETFQACLSQLREAGVEPGLVHTANSAGLLSHPESIFNAVRPGLALYGIAPSDRFHGADLLPAMELETQVSAVRTVAAGTPLGYGGRFVTRRTSTIGILPIGYHDGVRRSFTERVSALLRGGRAPIVGAVSMDLTLIDITDTGGQPGDRVVLLGRDGQHRITAWDLARAAGTIPYEIVCGIGARVPRAYK